MPIGLEKIAKHPTKKIYFLVLKKNVNSEVVIRTDSSTHKELNRSEMLVSKRTAPIVG